MSSDTITITIDTGHALVAVALLGAAIVLVCMVVIIGRLRRFRSQR